MSQPRSRSCRKGAIVRAIGSSLAVAPWVLASALISVAVMGAEEKPTPPPRVTAMAPLAVPQGFAGKVRLRGFYLKEATEVRTSAPRKPDRLAIAEKKDAAIPKGMEKDMVGDAEVVIDLTLSTNYPVGSLPLIIVRGEHAAPPVALRVLPSSQLIEETEPDNGFRSATKLEPGNSVAGAIKDQRDVDVFRIEGRAARPLRARVSARGAASLSDPLVAVYDAQGQKLAAADDDGLQSPAAQLQLTPETDGPIFIVVQDALDTGSDWHSYVLDVAPLPGPGEVSFASEVWPVLRANCVGCHRPGKLKGGLDLTSMDGLARGGDQGAVVKAGAPKDSPLIQSVAGDEPDMPKEGEKLTPADVALLTKWVAQGALDDTPRGGLGTQRPARAPVYDSPPAVRALAFSPDGTRLAIGAHHEVILRQSDGSSVTGRWMGDSPRIESLAFSRDGRFLAASGGSPSEFGEIQIWDATSASMAGSLRRAIRAGSDTLFGVSWTDDGSRLAAGGADKLVRAFDAATGSVLMHCDNHLDWVFGTAFVHDGSRLISVSRDKSVKLVDASSGLLVDDAARPRAPVFTLARHPKEDLVAFAGEEGNVRLHRMSPRGGRLKEGDDKEESAVREFEHMGTTLHAVAFSSDGARLACAGLSGEIRIFETASGRRQATIPSKNGAVFALAFHPTEHWLAAAGSDGLVRIYDAGDGKWRKEFSAVPLGSGEADAASVQRRPSEDPLPSFQRDILPVLTKYGCNQGGCHGKLTGQNGFRLSLRGFAPEWDHEWITREVNGRRIDFAFPEKSLLLEKPSGGLTHEGGTRFRKGSPPWQTLVNWIAARAPGPAPGEPMPVALEVSPSSATLRPGESLSVRVLAREQDGRTKDVTALAQFFSNDEALLSVTTDGKITARDRGAASARVHFLNLVQVITCSMPFEHEVASEVYRERRSAVDGPVFDKLRALRLPPSDLCGDAEFVRRAYLDTIGVLPSPEEASQFVADPDPGKRAVLADRLLVRPEWLDYWTLQLGDILQNRRERDHDVRGVKGVRSFHEWLRARLAAGAGWDTITREILTATGDVREHPAVGYFITLIGEHREVEKSELPDSVAQSFLGTRIGCARCHNHPLERYTQDDFYRFSAFFARTVLDRENPHKGGTLLHTTPREEKEQAKRVADLYRRLREGQAANQPKEERERLQRELTENEKRLADLKARPPQVNHPRANKPVTAQPLDHSMLAFPQLGDPRATLADWIIGNPDFAGAIVNRIWKHFFSVGLVEPVDDLRASNPPSNEGLWTLLGDELRRHHYDLRHLMRLILTSRAYQLSSTTRPENEKDTRFYSHYYPRRLPAEVLLDALSAATGVPDEFPGYPIGLRAVQLPEPGIGSYFLTLFGRSDRVTACACERRGEVTLPQLLNLRNSEELQRRLADGNGRLAALLKNPDNDSILDALYQVTLCRLPTKGERDLMSLNLSSGPREEVFRDLFWALLNSKEFTFNH